MDTNALNWPAVLHRQLPTADGEIHYVEAGAGEPVLLIHGGHGAWVHWMANIDALAQHRRVLALDLPGFGHSYDPGRRPDLSGYAAVVGSFIAALGLCNVALVGFSFGALVATTIASKQPDAVKSLVLINPALGARLAACFSSVLASFPSRRSLARLRARLTISVSPAPC